MTVCFTECLGVNPTNNSLSSANDRGQSIVILCLMLCAFCISELPPGWERIEDPVYGVYYVE